VADLIHVAGCAPGRVHLSFADTPADRAALDRFKRAGARRDGASGLWFVGEHNRELALELVVATGGSTGEPEWCYAAGNGELLASGWSLVAAGPAGIWFRNPWPDPPAELVVPWDQARHLAATAGPALRAAMIELGTAAARLYRPPPAVKTEG
jgi:hypothetical protein